MRYIVHIINSMKYGIMIAVVVIFAVVNNPIKPILDSSNPKLLVPLGIILAGMLLWLGYLIVTTRRRLCQNL